MKQILQSLRRCPQPAPKSLVLHSSTVQNTPSTELPQNQAIRGFQELTTREASRHKFLQALFQHLCLECSLGTELHPQAGPNSPLGFQRNATMWRETLRKMHEAPCSHSLWFQGVSSASQFLACPPWSQDSVKLQSPMARGNKDSLMADDSLKSWQC